MNTTLAINRVKTPVPVLNLVRLQVVKGVGRPLTLILSSSFVASQIFSSVCWGFTKVQNPSSLAVLWTCWRYVFLGAGVWL